MTDVGETGLPCDLLDRLIGVQQAVAGTCEADPETEGPVAQPRHTPEQTAESATTEAAARRRFGQCHSVPRPCVRNLHGRYHPGKAAAHGPMQVKQGPAAPDRGKPDKKPEEIEPDHGPPEPSLLPGFAMNALCDTEQTLPVHWSCDSGPAIRGKGKEHPVGRGALGLLGAQLGREDQGDVGGARIVYTLGVRIPHSAEPHLSGPTRQLGLREVHSHLALEHHPDLQAAWKWPSSGSGQSQVKDYVRVARWSGQAALSEAASRFWPCSRQPDKAELCPRDRGQYRTIIPGKGTLIQ